MKRRDRELKKAQDDAAEARAEVAKLKEEREIEKCVADAQRDYEFVAGASSEDLGRLLYVTKSLDKKDRDLLIGIFKTCNETIKNAAMFEERGSSIIPAAPGTAQAELDALIKTTIEENAEYKKMRPALARARAMRDIAKTNTALVMRVRSEAN